MSATSAVGAPLLWFAATQRGAFSGLLAAAAVGAAYRWLLDVVSPVHVQASAKHLSLWRAPLPWRSLCFRTREVARVETRWRTRETRWGTATDYLVAVELAGGGEVLFADGFKDPAEAEYLRDVIQAYLPGA